MNLPPDRAALAWEAIRASAGQAAALWLSGVGASCTAFDLDAVAEPDRTPCAGCGSQVAPTGYGLFHRTISLIYLRFTARKEGNFCVPCAWKISAGYNGVMLVGDHLADHDAGVFRAEPVLPEPDRLGAEGRAELGTDGGLTRVPGRPRQRRRL